MERGISFKAHGVMTWDISWLRIMVLFAACLHSLYIFNQPMRDEVLRLTHNSMCDETRDVSPVLSKSSIQAAVHANKGN